MEEEVRIFTSRFGSLRVHKEMEEEVRLFTSRFGSLKPHVLEGDRDRRVALDGGVERDRVLGQLLRLVKLISHLAR